MLLASTPPVSRPLHCAAYMGEPTSRSTSRIPLPSPCSVDSSDGDDGADAQMPSLRPRSIPSNPSEGTPSKHSRTAATFASVDVESTDNIGDVETCSNDVPPSKGASCLTATYHSFAAEEANSSVAEVAVREEGEDDSKEEDQSSHSQRQGPSPSSSFLVTNRLPLASVLKNFSLSSSLKTGRTYRTRRRIRGIWGDNNDSQFSQLHNETLLLIMKYLSMKDLCVASMVCQRWKHTALHQDSWRRIDATDFVEAAYDYYGRMTLLETMADRSEAPKSTTLALATRIERHKPLVLEIQTIRHRLSADNFLSSLPSLQELTLTCFDELTDTHIHVLLLSSSCKNVKARSNRSCVLRKLVLDQCPRLTDAAVQSIGNLCPELEELSLKGNPKIMDLSPLKDLWQLVKKPPNLSNSFSTRRAPPISISSMSLLFGGPPTAAVAPAPAPAPSPPISKTPTTSLQSLFAPPGLSPPRAADAISILRRTISISSNANESGKLTRINVSDSGVSSKTLLAAWKSIPAGTCICLEKLIIGGTGESWSDSLLGDLAEMLDLPKLQSLNIGCSPTATSRMTDKGLMSLLTGKDALPSLKNLNLSGHSSLSGTGLGELITAASPTLEELVLDGCKGISSKSNSPAKDFSNCDALAKAIWKCTTREIKRKGGNQRECVSGLRRLVLSGCFSNQSKLQRNISLQMHEETLGTYLLDAIGPKQKKTKQSTANSEPAFCTTSTVATLQELDLSDCWFVTSADIASLKKRCPGLHRIHLQGTRANVTG